MIRTAMEESQLTMDITSGVNCPVNHNLVPIEDITQKSFFKKTSNTLDLKVIHNDLVLPMKSLMTGKCSKKNKTIGSEVRFLLLGAS